MIFFFNFVILIIILNNYLPEIDREEEMSDPLDAPFQSGDIIESADGNFPLKFYFYYFYFLNFLLLLDSFEKDTVEAHLKSLNTSLCGGTKRKKSKRSQEKKVRGFFSNLHKF